MGIAFSSLAAAPETIISYNISVERVAEHLFDVYVLIPGVRGSIKVQMPAWNATYQIRDFASHIRDVRAETGPDDEHLHALPISMVDKQTWLIKGDGLVRFGYSIFWDEPGPFASQLDSNHAFMNLAEILVSIPDRRKDDVGISYHLHSPPLVWDIANPLGECGRLNAGRYVMYNCRISTYDAAVDAPVEIGQFERFDLEGISPPVHVVVHGENWDKKRLAEGLSKIVKYETQLMGGAPYKEYTFLIHIGSEFGGGGMEHANSTAISAGSTQGAIEIAAHEFFHLWNVKRIRPQSLEPVDYTREMWTRALWFAEGVTSTYASYTEVRSGMWTREQFYFDLASQISALESRPARKWMSVEESSLDAWFEKYPLHNQPDFSISYYNKGQLVGDCLDILIRDATENHQSLDDVLRAMNENFAKKGKFYNDSADIEATAEAVAKTDFHDFFAKYVAGTDEVPFKEILAKAGLDLSVITIKHADAGFESSTNFEGNIVVVSSVAPGGPAHLAGLRAGDMLLTLDGESASDGVDAMLSLRKPGDVVKIRLRRGELDQEISVTLGSRTSQEYRVEELRGATDKQKRIREGMLKGTTN